MLIMVKRNQRSFFKIGLIDFSFRFFHAWMNTILILFCECCGAAFSGMTKFAFDGMAPGTVTINTLAMERSLEIRFADIDTLSIDFMTISTC
jgi:hypothetical protein